MTFLLANWRWLLPLIVCVGLAADDGWHRIELSDLRAEVATAAAAAEKKLNAAKAADAIRTRQLEDAHALEVARLKEAANAAQLAIARAPVTAACVVTPSARAFSDGLRRFDPPPGTGQPGATPGAGAPVRPIPRAP